LSIWHCILSAELTKDALHQTVFLAIFSTGNQYERLWLIPKT